MESKKTKVTIEVDIQSITDRLIKNEGVGGFGSINYEVEREIKQQAIEDVKKEIRKSAKIEELIKADYGREYITDLAKNTINETLKEKISNYCQEWINANMQFVVEESLKNIMDKLLVPRLQKMIANMLIVDTESEEEAMDEMQKALEAEAKGAYEAGQIAAAKEIRRSI